MYSSSAFDLGSHYDHSPESLSVYHPNIAQKSSLYFLIKRYVFRLTFSHTNFRTHSCLIGFPNRTHIAALLAVLNTSLTYKLPATVYLSFPAISFLAYTIFALCLLLSQISLEFCQANPAISRSPRPININIHAATQSAAVPINLARLSGFSATDPREHQGVQEPDKFSTEFAEHQKRPSVDSGISIISTFKPTNFVGSTPPSRSNSRQGTNTPEFDPLTVLQFHTRIQGLLPLLSLLLAQSALCASYSCKLAIDYKPLSAHVLEITRTSLSVVGVMATMKAYLREFPLI